MPAENIADTQMRLLKLQFPGDPGFLPDLMAKAKITDYGRYGQNLLSANQAGIETDTTGWTGQAATLARSTTEAAEGAASLSITSTAATTSAAATQNMPTSPGQTFTAVASIKGGTTGRPARVEINWRTPGGALLSSSQGNIVTTSTAWQVSSVTATAPADAALMTVKVFYSSSVIGQVIYADKIGLFEGDYATGLYLPPGATTGRNLLTPNQASLETNTTGWVSSTNSPTLARSTAQAADGAASLSLTAVPAGPADMAAGTVQNGPAIPVAPGQTLTAFASFRAATVARGVFVQLDWHSATTGGYITSTTGAGVPDTTTGWTARTVTGTAPAGANYVRVIVKVQNVPSGEVHYVDRIGLFEGNVNYWTAP